MRLPYAIILFFLAFTSPSYARSKLYFYPPPIQFNDGFVLSSPLTISADQATSLFPKIKEMSGVVVTIAWSELCPNINDCNFEMIDNIVDYWRKQYKSVVLQIATVGYPYKTSENGRETINTITPDWVLDRVLTYTVDMTPLGDQSSRTTRFPRYSDKNFLKLTAELIAKMHKYDMDSGVEAVRISLGMLGEDNPNPVGGLEYQFAGFSNSDWIEYCAEIRDIFIKNFKGSRLEVDIGVIGWILAAGTADEKQAAEALISSFVSNNMTIGFNGWSSNSFSKLLHDPGLDGEAECLLLLADADRHGATTAIEAVGPLTGDNVTDIEAMIKAAELLRPKRITVFAFTAGILDVQRNGPLKRNETTRQFVNVQPLKAQAIINVNRLINWWNNQPE